MDPSLNSLVPKWKQAYYQFKSLRNVPFRKKFFVGYDLSANTYWEFKLEANTNLRRIFEPHLPNQYIHDHYSTVPVQWQQWLRYNRYKVPTLQELRDDQLRIKNIQQLSAQADQRWALEKRRLEEESNLSLRKELSKLEKEKEMKGKVMDIMRKNVVKGEEDPFERKRREESQHESGLKIKTRR